MTVYAVEDLGVSIAGGTLVSGVGFAIGRGECVALIGASGSGKSQSSLAPFGLAAGTPSGSARLAGTELVGLPEPALARLRAREAGFVFQQPATALAPHLTIAAQLAEAWRQAGAPRPDRAELVALLDRTGLPRAATYLRHYPHQLSGGERQRVMIAAAIAHRPKLLVADEPTSALDAPLRHEVLDLLGRLRDEDGLALLLVSHDLAAVARHADRLVVLDAGRMVEAGPTAQIVAAPASDQTRRLLAATPPLAPRDAPPRAAGPPLLAANAISVSFAGAGWRAGRVAAVVEASLAVSPGEGLAVLGRSGSGKSTLARAIARLGPADRGTVTLEGRPLPPRARMRPADRRPIQPVFQDPVASLDPLWTVGEAVAEPLRRFAPELDRAGRLARASAALAEVGLDPALATRRTGALSGGQAQRVAIARALVAEPRLLLLDEATSSLDVLVAAQIVALIRRLQQDRGLALLFVTHDIALAATLCDRMLVMEDGRVVEHGATADLVRAPRHPATRRLVEASS